MQAIAIEYFTHDTGSSNESRIRENERPPRHLERQMMAGERVFPQCADTDNEEPHGKTPEPEADENADDFNDSAKLRIVKKVWRYHQVCLAAELSNASSGKAIGTDRHEDAGSLHVPRELLRHEAVYEGR